MPASPLLQPVLVGSLILLFLLVGALWPRERAPILTPSTWLNLANGAFLFLLRLAFTAGITTGAATLELPRPIDLSGLQDPWLGFVVAFAAQDLARYGLHCAHHRVRFLWRFHRVHHSSEHLDATSGLRMHLVDFVQLNLVPVVLFGVLLDCRSFDPRVWLAIPLVVHGMDAWQHGNLAMSLRGPLARWWNTLFVSPYFHSWHHARDWRRHDGNYGQTLALWDHLFGTAVDEVEPCRDLGLPEDQALEESLLGLQMLRPRRR